MNSAVMFSSKTDQWSTLLLAYPSPSPEPDETAWQKNSDLMDWLKSLGK